MHDLPHGYLWRNKEARYEQLWNFCVDYLKGDRDTRRAWLAAHHIQESCILGMGGELNMYFFHHEADAIMFYLRWGNNGNL